MLITWHISISLQDLTCHNQHCEAAYRCWHNFDARYCWPPENHNECHEYKGACFPSIVKLRLEDGKYVAMSELQVGDRIQTGLL